jgi:general stress protein 26
MKKLILPLMLAAIVMAFYQMGKESPNVIILCISIAVFMGGMMWLSSKTPSKNQDDDV